MKTILRVYQGSSVYSNIEYPTIEDIVEAIKRIPPSSIFISQGSGFISDMIGIWGFINYFSYVWKWFRKTKSLRGMWSHTGFYFGGGKHAVVEAVAKGVSENSILDYFNKKTKFLEIWSYNNFTTEKLQVLKDFCYKQIGKKYDILSFLDFLLNSKLDDPKAFICSELVVTGMKMFPQIPFMDVQEKNKVHPVQLFTWFNEEGIKKEWSKIVDYRTEG